jgi:fructokinase
MTAAVPLFGCIEAGGTKFVVALASSHKDIVDRTRIDTRTPDVTLDEAIAWLKAASAAHGPLSAIGIASFGPLELDRAASNWGHITTTTKPHWSNTNFAQRFAREFGVPVGFDTDVNGAALAEARWGAGQGQRINVYVTIGTGIGGGVIVGGVPLRGLSHPEMGHIRLQRHRDDLEFAGICPFHGDCLEGLASGPAIKARWGDSLSKLPADHPGHDIIASYLAQLVVTLQAILEPGKIILGGGVMATPGLIERVRNKATTLGASYFRGNPADIITAPALGCDSGLLGALALAQDVIR